MGKTSSNKNLHSASKAKQDEFYTQLNDISKELRHYRDQLQGKVILCNCDDPFESNFFKYFAANFNALKIKKLIATSYVKSPIVGGQLSLIEIEGLKPEGKEPYVVIINEVPDLNKDGAVSLDDVEHLLRHNKNVSRPLKGDLEYNAGDFRSKECVAFLEEADIVITNPPFSLFREFVALLEKHNKDFIIIGNINAISYREIFKLIKKNKMWLGYSHRNHGIGMFFDIPQSVNTDFATRLKDGKIFIGGAVWFTSLDTPLNHEPMTLYKTYVPEEYPKYYNYNAIEVSRTKNIPMDYDGHMGVPITFLNSGYNPDQFEIIGLGISNSGIEIGVRPYKREHRKYRVEIQKRAAVNGDLYMMTDGVVNVPYARIIIKRKI
ncbi:MAG: adenine-specific methyltransferase EcoRI family protein [Candidatus Shapirobacteria bacterium]